MEGLEDPDILQLLFFMRILFECYKITCTTQDPYRRVWRTKVYLAWVPSEMHLAQ